MEFATHHRRSTCVVACLALWLIVGCASGGESIAVPGADAVVTAPVAPDASVDVAPTTEPDDAPPETPTSRPSEPSTSAIESTGTDPATTGPAASPPSTEISEEEPAPDTAPSDVENVDDDVFLRLGDEGPEVATMQRKLASIDYLPDGSDTGVFDETTRAGLRRFQGDYGLGVDGVFGPITGRSLNAAVSSINAGG